MKSKKFLTAITMAMLLLCSMLVFAACAPDTDDSGEDNTPKKEMYQLLGKYEESGSFSSYTNYAFMLDLKEDGNAVMARYGFDSYDTSPAATNPTYFANYMTGTWAKTVRDGADSLQIKIALVNEDGTKGETTTYYSFEVDGEFSFDLAFILMPGTTFTRQCTLSGKALKKYADGDAFIQAYKKTFVEPANVGKFIDSEDQGTVYLKADGTLAVYNGYSEIVQGKWGKDADGVDIIIKTTEITVNIDGKKASFEYSHVMLAGYDPEVFNFVCADYTALPDTALPV